MSADPVADALLPRVSDLLQRRIGLRPDSTLQGRLRRGVRDEATAHHQDLDAYVRTLETSPVALQGLVNRVTVQETGFFRHPEHFQILADDILPRLRRPVRIWSAGCSNGQEAFTIAMVLEENGVAGSVLATDLSTAALKRTTAAHYTPREMRGLSPDRIARHFTHTSHGWFVNDSLRARVTTLQHNLVDRIPELAAAAQVVFCRNVLIYFSPDQARAFIHRVADELPDAAIFLGSAEAMWPISHRYETVRTDDAFYYRLRTTNTAPPTPHPRADAARPVARSGAASAPRVATAPPRMAPPAMTRTAPAPQPVSADAAGLTRAGQHALDAGDTATAVVAFRKCAYLSPDDPLAHLHLGLALEASGDLGAARRAYRAARHAVDVVAPTLIEGAIGGYSAGELIRLLDTKGQVLGP